MPRSTACRTSFNAAARDGWPVRLAIPYGRPNCTEPNTSPAGRACCMARVLKPRKSLSGHGKQLVTKSRRARASSQKKSTRERVCQKRKHARACLPKKRKHARARSQRKAGETLFAGKARRSVLTENFPHA